MRPPTLQRPPWLLVLAAFAMLVGPALTAQAGPKMTPTAVMSATASPEPTGEDVFAKLAPDEVSKEEEKLNNLKANATKNAASNKKKGENSKVRPSMWTEKLVLKLSLGIAFFAILILACVTILLRQSSDKVPPEQVLRTFGILVIIFAAIFLVIAGYSDTQITPVIGLLGTIAGYLLGRKIEPPAAGGGGRDKTTDETKR